MNKVLRNSITIALASVMIGLAASYARADKFDADSCFGSGCSANLLTTDSVASSLTMSALQAEAMTSFANLVLPLDGAAESVSVSKAAAQSTSDDNHANTARRDSVDQLTSVAPSWSFVVASQPPVETGSSALTAIGQSPMTVRQSNFSVTSVSSAVTTLTLTRDSKATPTVHSNFMTVAAPEPATMILFGTGLLGAAAIMRRRLRKS